jgi:uncharacterized protein YkwD
LISIRSGRLGSRLPLASLSALLHRHRAVARALIAGLTLALAAGVSSGGAARAGLTAILPVPPSILPVNVGVGIGTQDGVTLTFAHAMDRASVEAGFSITPAGPVRLSWSDDRLRLQVIPRGLWLTDQRYALVVPASARLSSGALLGAPATYSFTTQTAPRIEEFRLHFVAEPAGGSAALDGGAADVVGPPPDVASGVSAGTSIQITFSTAMNHAEVERAFLLSPAVPGIFRWSGSTLTFAPMERLASGARYAVSLMGVHDRDGSPLAGNGSFSFTTRAGAQLVQSTPAAGATRVADKEIVLWFSQPMDPDAVAAAMQVRDRTTGKTLTGSLSWSASGTQLHFTPARALTAGHRFDVSLAAGAIDADGNPVTASLTFTTRAATSRILVPGPAPSATLVGYALNQVNAARAAYGLPPLVLDNTITAEALAYAWDMVRYDYFGHTGRDGSTHRTRMAAAGITFGWSGENLCMNDGAGRTTTGMLDWCQSEFMSEPYPGVANHIGNILSTHFTRVGVGIAISGGKTIIVWDFAD